MSEIDYSGIFIDEEGLLPAASSVGRTINAALGVGGVEVTEHPDNDVVRIRRIDQNASDMVAVFKAQERPVFAVVGGFEKPDSGIRRARRVVFSGSNI